MNLNEYQEAAMGFRLRSAGADYALFNLPGEVGELMSLEAKLIRDGGSVNEYLRKKKKELGDILWHVAAIAKDCGWTLDEVGLDNIEKLRERSVRNTLQGSGDDR